MASRYPLAMKNGSASSEIVLLGSSGKNMKNIELLLENYKSITCEDRSCPDYGKSIDVYDGTYRGLLLHVEVVNGNSYNVQINKEHGSFNLTYEEFEKFVGKHL